MCIEVHVCAHEHSHVRVQESTGACILESVRDVYALVCPCTHVSVYSLGEQRLRTSAKKRKGGCQVKAETSPP